ncbi:MAG: hypothetical protein ABFE07_06480 [Armatimonadia bacterium]
MTRAFWFGFLDGWTLAAAVTFPAWTLMFLCMGIWAGSAAGIPLAIAWSLTGVYSVHTVAARLRASAPTFIEFWMDIAEPSHD